MRDYEDKGMEVRQKALESYWGERPPREAKGLLLRLKALRNLPKYETANVRPCQSDRRINMQRSFGTRPVLAIDETKKHATWLQPLRRVTRTSGDILH
ncbi:hypothetical protein ACO22_01786 [Paracoccidioides brasiliensis]|uniref:Uncharacterized protein n=1 Tax=Paracoccidioides brasiliensis TaxID=121759 RepID=A0A1D2JKI0_PARBR|nr:hypothetical protein ACO22_01786 [Paracoccidioides brasiliensis]